MIGEALDALGLHGTHGSCTVQLMALSQPSASRATSAGPRTAGSARTWLSAPPARAQACMLHSHDALSTSFVCGPQGTVTYSAAMAGACGGSGPSARGQSAAAAAATGAGGQAGEAVAPVEASRSGPAVPDPRLAGTWIKVGRAICPHDRRKSCVGTEVCGLLFHPPVQQCQCFASIGNGTYSAPHAWHALHSPGPSGVRCERVQLQCSHATNRKARG